jgi:hypothetical protein
MEVLMGLIETSGPYIQPSAGTFHSPCSMVAEVRDQTAVERVCQYIQSRNNMGVLFYVIGESLHQLLVGTCEFALQQEPEVDDDDVVNYMHIPADAPMEVGLPYDIQRILVKYGFDLKMHPSLPQVIEKGAPPITPLAFLLSRNAENTEEFLCEFPKVSSADIQGLPALMKSLQWLTEMAAISDELFYGHITQIAHTFEEGTYDGDIRGLYREIHGLFSEQVVSERPCEPATLLHLSEETFQYIIDLSYTSSLQHTYSPAMPVSDFSTIFLNGMTVLGHAIYNNKISVVKELIDAGILLHKPCAAWNNGQVTPLMFAVKYGREEIVSLILAEMPTRKVSVIEDCIELARKEYISSKTFFNALTQPWLAQAYMNVVGHLETYQHRLQEIKNT